MLNMIYCARPTSIAAQQWRIDLLLGKLYSAAKGWKSGVGVGRFRLLFSLGYIIGECRRLLNSVYGLKGQSLRIFQET